MSKTENKEKLGRDGMIFCFRWQEIFNNLSDEQLRRFLNALFDFGRDGTEPDFTGTEKCLWLEFSQRVKYDLLKYAEISKKRREAGLKRASKYQQLLASAGEAVPDTVTDTVTDAGAEVSLIDNISPYPNSTEDVLKMAEKLKMPCEPIQAEFYLASRQATDWVSADHKKIKNPLADLKRWLIRGASEKRKFKKPQGAGEGQWQV